ncbi:hypothetical protein BYT27DRAFT_7249726 [Phlegmacium glaucopus]|nr:hypothetical protein BYT27DRAFT_7249726 [Phlegmacium glaucopus]
MLVPFLEGYGADFVSVNNLENSGFDYNDSNSASGANLEAILRNRGTMLESGFGQATSNTRYGSDCDVLLPPVELLIDLHGDIKQLRVRA